MALFGKKQISPTERTRAVRSAQPQKVFSYYSARSEEARQPIGRYQNLAPRRLPKKGLLRNLPSMLAAVAIGLSVLYCLGVDSKARIITFQPSNQVVYLREPDVYQAAAAEIIDSSIMNGNKLSFDRSAVARGLKSRFPELSHVEISMPLIGRRPIVNLRGATPALLLATGSKAFIIGTDGKAIIDVVNAKRAQADSLPRVTDESSLEAEAGKAILSPEDVLFIRTLEAQAKVKDMAIESMVLPAVASELHVRFRGVPYYVKFNMLEDPRQQAGTFFATKSHLEASGTTPQEYIDVRVTEKAYFK